ncbi:MAG TPA: TIGR04222 domain-containing membrane protein [Gemmatimonadaceae bacterium]|nr:TIGR04222 domain-containing membrane protein [Gemmatimonadaceae bacterium]
MGILDLPGPQFLSLYLGLLGIAGPVAIFLRHWLRRPGGSVDVRFLKLRPFEIGYLAGGDRQAVSAMVASLAKDNVVTVGEREPTIIVAGPLPAGSDTVERALLGLLGTGPTTIERTTEAATSTLMPVRRKLMDLGLLIPERASWMPRVIPALVLVAVLLLGIAKIMIGVSRDRPVGFLVGLCLLVAGGATWLLVAGPQRSLLGDKVLDRLRSANAGLQQTAAVKPDRLSSDDLGLAVGLFGASAIATGPMGDLSRAMTHERAKQTDRRGHSSCSSCGSGCGGGSCGGGCGGGCGGCGS